MTDALISIKPEYVTKILMGAKSVELRRRRVQLPPGAHMWIYSTLPRGRIEAVAQVFTVVHGSPEAIWYLYGDELCLSRDAFKGYANGSTVMSAIVLNEVRPLRAPLSLAMLRTELRGFHPPQYLTYLKRGHPLLKLVRKEDMM